MSDDTPTKKRKVLLGSPGYGGMSHGAAVGVFKASLRPATTTTIIEMVSHSLLAHGFNQLWCQALNVAAKDGLGYFAMIHSDIEPQPGWLDVLIDELEAQQLDVLGVAVPIKDARGLTSIAVARDDGDTWNTHCRLTMTEIHRLPETFTSADLGGKKLLLNTGLWVCKFDPAWAEQVHFTINDRIVKDPDGTYYPQVESEDWFFSRLLHEQQLKVGCTRKVPLGHRGETAFPNANPWGRWKYDENHLEQSILGPEPEHTPGG